jgi:hypothetical protein
LARPTVLAREQVLPVAPALRDLLPGGALQRGTTVGISGDAATSVALALLAGPSAAGSWTAVVGLPSLGVAAAAELGVSIDRLVLVRDPSSSWGAVTAALVGAFDVVLLAQTNRLPVGDARRLVARSRERGSVLVQLENGARSVLEPDLRLSTGCVQWHGLGKGHGRLLARRVRIDVSGRRRAARHRRSEVWLSCETDGRVEMAMAGPEEDATVTPLSAKRAG